MFDQQKSNEFELTPELAAFGKQLGRLSPVAPHIDRDQLMFNAGRAAQRAGQDGRAIYLAGPSWAGPFRTRFWPAATVTMTAATLLLSAMLVRERQQHSLTNDSQPRAAVVANSHDAYTDLSFALRSSQLRATSGYLGVRNTALSRSAGALATQFDSNRSVSPLQSKPATARDLRNELLPNTPRQRG